MKIAVFGDSYGRVSDNTPRKLSEKSNSWVNHLKRLGAEEFNVTNYSWSGTSLFYSISLFLEHHMQYDKIIFLTTSQGRIDLDNNFINSLATKNLQRHLSGYEHAIELIKKFKTNEFDCKVYQAAADYFLYVQNPDSDNFKHNLMVEKIKSVRPDALVISCFGDIFDEHEFRLKMISDIDLNYYDRMDKSSMADHRHSHMNDENNIILAEKIYNWVKTGNISLEISDFVKPSEPPEYYGF